MQFANSSACEEVRDRVVLLGLGEDPHAASAIAQLTAARPLQILHLFSSALRSCGGLDARPHNGAVTPLCRCYALAADPGRVEVDAPLRILRAVGGVGQE